MGLLSGGGGGMPNALFSPHARSGVPPSQNLGGGDARGQ